MAKRIGFIGLGVMGAPMARNVAVKYASPVVYDVDAARLVAIPDSVPADSVRSVGRISDVVILSLPNSNIVREVVLGADGLAAAMNVGSVVIDTSTTEPTTSREIAKALKALKMHFLDAPVSGGEKAAIDGTLSFMVGGDEQVFNDCASIFDAMGTTVVRMGGSGAGETAKMVNQMIVGATFAIVAESFALGVKSGLDLSVLYEAIQNGWAGSRVLDVAAPAIIERNFRPGGTVNIHAKDLDYALSLAKDMDVPTPVTALVHEIFKAARAGGLGGESQPAIVKLWERLLRVHVGR